MRNLNKSPEPAYRIVGVQFVPRTSVRPAVFTMQRLRQVREAARHLLKNPPYSLQDGDLAYHVDCASFGGFTAQLAAIFYPQEFHAATASAYTAAHRSMPCDFDSHVFSTSLLAMDAAGHSYTMRDTVEIPMWCRIEQTDFASISFTNRWYRDPLLSHIQRPVYFVLGDEDTVTHGTDWVAILNRGSWLNGTQRQSGTMPTPNVFGNTVNVRWSVVSKSGHGEHRPNEFTLEKNPTEQTDKLEEIVDFMLGEAYAQLSLPPGTIRTIDDPSLGRKLTNTLALPSLEPSREALGQRGVRQHASGSRQTLLGNPPPTFRRYGQGTWLGANESLKVKKLAGDPRASIFVGSADGFVTRLMMEPRPLGNPTIRPLVEKARSKKDGQPYALGHGTWGLDVGQVDASTPQLEVVVASYNRIALFTADTLDFIREMDLPDPADVRIPAEKRWEYVDPRKVQIADLVSDAGGDGEIAFRTLLGHFVIMDKALAIKYEHGEGGIVDFVVGPEASSTPWLQHPIYLLSARGHVARLEINTSPSFVFPDQGELAGASHLEYGGMRDLDLVTFQGQPHLAALFVPHLGTNDAMRFFRLGDCARVGQFGDLQNQPPADPPESAPHPAPSGDREPSFTFVAGHGSDRYVVSSGGHLSVWDGQVALGHKDLSTFPPASGHGCVQAGDIDEDSASPGEEVVVATSAGKVVWFKLGDLTTPGLSLAPGLTRTAAASFVTDPADGLVYEHRCNLSLGATWAMAPSPSTGKLRVVDPVGTWWEVDAAGKPSYVNDLGVGVLGLVDAGASSVAVANGGGTPPTHLFWQTVILPQNPLVTYLTSTPYVPMALPGGPWFLPAPGAGPFVWHDAGQWVLPSGGAAYTGSGSTWLAWWQRAGTFTHLIQRVRYTVGGGQANVQDIWGSTQRALPGGVGPPRFPPTHPDYVKALRSEMGEVAPMNMQTLRIGRVLPGDTPQVVASGMGGRVMVLDGNTGTIVTESPDYGLGGIALAVGNLDSDDRDEIVFAPIYDPIVPGTQTVRSTLRVLEWANGALSPIGSPVPVGEAGNPNFPGYGTCGIAIADLSIWPLNPPLGKVVIVTTLNGELVIFEVQSGGSLNPQPLLRKVVEGSIGAFGSIAVENLDASDPRPELYLAGSSGIRRFDFQ